MEDFVRFERNRFATRLPTAVRYTEAHYWIRPAAGEPGLWQVGFTTFATRMLGDLVEYDFDVKPGDAVQAGQVIGYVEAFKATSEIFCEMDGTFAGVNPELEKNIDAVTQDPYGSGWLYAIRTDTPVATIDAAEYAAMLDRTITCFQQQGQGGGQAGVGGGA